MICIECMEDKEKKDYQLTFHPCDKDDKSVGDPIYCLCIYCSHNPGVFDVFNTLKSVN